MTTGSCWGTQIGGIPDPSSSDDMALQSDLEDRVRDFLHRHGDAEPAQRRTGTLDQGLRGWAEIRARDGYVLRIEWSRSALRSTLTAIEQRP